MDFKKLIIIMFVVNIIIWFLLLGMAIIPGINLVAVPTIIWCWMGINVIFSTVCLFKCTNVPGVGKFF